MFQPSACRVGAQATAPIFASPRPWMSKTVRVETSAAAGIHHAAIFSRRPVCSSRTS
jgi:hypothetical protein